MKKAPLLFLFIFLSTMIHSFGQENYETYFFPASKNAAKDYRRVTTILEATGQLEDKELVERIEAKLALHQSNPNATEWAQYIYELKIPDDLKGEGHEMLKNLKHNGAHILGDIMLAQGNYQEAIRYFKEALVHPYFSFSVINMIKAEIDITAKLVTCYEKLSQTDAIYTTTLPIILSNIKLGRGTVVEKQLIRVAATNKAAIKKSMDQGLAQVKSLKVNNNYFGEVVEETFFSFMFQGQKISVLYYGGTAQDFMKEVRNSNFYKSLM